MKAAFALVFFLIFAPLGMILRLGGYDPLCLKHKGQASAFNDRNRRFEKADFET